MEMELDSLCHESDRHRTLPLPVHEQLLLPADWQTCD